ncbi:hypothetical protein [Aurantiacibacter gangjinensis]|uniref:Tail tape measure protein n=1 Tax=Aurantiacibacter gangjinensis TaxID=502682 RepID=A0A0G9MQW3_9SPHN|nr:hypothetical protein [Aurantiacibacter gangjinensis]APE27653.1 Gene Transfer Agent tail tape measure [Aurantiacibacter gangjinensis]KLE31673.1 tail tape measure protein [Aurantiacibacter gangjinensis]
MDETIDTLMVDIRASTSGFRADVEGMRATLDNSLLGGFTRAGDVLERSLLSAIRRGKLGFDELKEAALSALNQIAAQAVQSGISQLFGGTPGGGGGAQGGGLGSMLGSLFGSLLGLPGRATGGPVAPGSAYIVGERGPELFVPTSSGRVETGMPGASARDVRVSINLAAPRGTDAPVMLRRSSRQVASAVARAMREG